MSGFLQRLVAGILAFGGGLVVVAAAGLLIDDAFAARIRLPQDEARVEALSERGRTDAAIADQLHTEYERQTQTSLERDARSGELAKVLLIAGIVFLVGAKWLVTLSATRIRVPRHLCLLKTEPFDVPATPGEPAAGVTSLPVIDEVDLSLVDEIVEREGREPAAAIPILHALQAHYRYLPNAALRRVCELTNIPPAQLTGVASFYAQFRHQPMGKHLVTVCHGTACHVAGAPRITDALRRQLGLAPGEDTDRAREFTLQEVPCLGCCTLAPVVQVDGDTHAHVGPDTAAQLLENLPETALDHRPRETTAALAEDVGEVRIGLGSCCVANGSGGVYDAWQAALAATGASVRLKRVGCVGMCHQTPLVEVLVPGRPAALYSRVRPEHVPIIVHRHFRPRGLTRWARSMLTRSIDALRDGQTQRAVSDQKIALRDAPVAAFLQRQKHIATEHYGDHDPLDLDEYIAGGGFDALDRCREGELSPQAVIEQIQESGLRGRGGAGFPTGTKWEKVRRASGEQKCIICNGDEGDPGAFMDRMLMESYPYRIIEGLAIAAYAAGATEGVFYIRAEYPLAVSRIEAAIQRCEQRGLLGEGAPLVDHRPLRLRVARGAGAFVCGEETALIASLEGRRGMPSLRPPYPAEHGLYGRPTLVNNVETYAVVPWILRHGANAFAALGTPTSKGTKVFALAGKVARGGLIEVPMGITVREIVEEIGGGIRSEELASGTRRHTFKAVQIGGPSGGCIPASLADTPVDYEALAEVGAIMGSGGLVVLDETDCMVDIARYFLSFTQRQSCGQCTPCRVGTRRMLEILERLCNGEGRAGDLDTLEELADAIKKTSLCSLGKTAPNPVLTTLRYFREEYEAHLEGRCPAGKCPALIRYAVTDDCTGCTLCAQHCPAEAIELRPYEKHHIDTEKCTRCDVCRAWCPEDAIEVL